MLFAIASSLSERCFKIDTPDWLGLHPGVPFGSPNGQTMTESEQESIYITVIRCMGISHTTNHSRSLVYKSVG